MAFPFPVSELVRPLRVDAAHAITISMKLQRRAPKNLSPAGRKDLAHLKAATARLNEHVAADLVPDELIIDARPLARRAIVAWGCLFQRLDTLTRLDADAVPAAAEARTLRDAVFADGLTFTRGDYETLWLLGQHTLDAMTAGAHVEAVERLAGDFVLRAVRGAHQSLGVGLGLTGSMRAPSVSGVDPVADRRTLLDAVTDAIARYAHQVTAIDADDPAAVAEAVGALAPIVKHRAKSKAARAAAESDDETDAPVADPAAPIDAPAANDTTQRRVA